MTRVCAAIVLSALLWSAGTVTAEIVWVNDWDTPAEQKNWVGIIAVVASDHKDYSALRDLDGDGRHGSLRLDAISSTWGTHEVAAPPGYSFKGITLTWLSAGHHGPTEAGFSMAVSSTGQFKGEQIAQTTPTNSTGTSTTLSLDLTSKPEFEGVSKVHVRLTGWLHAGSAAGWKLGCGGLVMNAQIVGPDGALVRRPKVRAKAANVKSFLVDRGRKCVVRPETDLVMNGYAGIEPEIFGLTAYEGAPDFDTMGKAPGIEFCKEYGIESVGFPGIMAWSMPSGWWSKLTRKQIADWFDSGKAANEFRNHGDYTARYVYGRILPALRGIGVRSFMYVYGPQPPFTDCKEGDDGAARWIYVSTRWIGLCLEADPDLKYFHLYGEPNARWFKRNVGSNEYVEFFSPWAKAVKATYPDVKLGGPVTYNSPTAGVDWNGWCRHLIDSSHAELDFLDWHSYNEPVEKLEGDLHVVTAYAKMRYDRWIRNALTETNYNVGGKENWHNRDVHYTRRAVPMIKQTLSFLRNPDKIFSRQFHDYGAWAGGYNARFCGTDEMPVTPMMELYKIFKPLRGRRVVTTNPFHDVMIEAAVRDKRLAIAIANFGDQVRLVPLSVPGLAREDIVETSAQIFTIKQLADYKVPEDLVFELPGRSLVMVVYTTEEPIEAAEQRKRWEYFADDCMTPIGTGGLWQVETPIRLNEAVRRAAKAATLRFGIRRKGEVSGQSWFIDVDGQRYLLEEPLAFCELRLPRVPSGNTVHVTFTCDGAPKTAYAVSFASVVLSGDADYGPPDPTPAGPDRELVWSNDFGTAEQRKDWTGVCLDDAAADIDGDGLGGYVQLLNVTNSTWGTERIAAPAGRKMKNLLVEWNVYRVTENGTEWKIALSPTAKFDKRAVFVEVPPGMGKVNFRLDLAGKEEFAGLSSVYLRLVGSNGAIDWSSKAGPVKVIATLE